MPCTLAREPKPKDAYFRKLKRRNETKFFSTYAQHSIWLRNSDRDNWKELNMVSFLVSQTPEFQLKRGEDLRMKACVKQNRN